MIAAFHYKIFDISMECSSSCHCMCAIILNIAQLGENGQHK